LRLWLTAGYVCRSEPHRPLCHSLAGEVLLQQSDLVWGEASELHALYSHVVAGALVLVLKHSTVGTLAKAPGLSLCIPDWGIHVC
jgi:hypothetical protein